MFPRIPRSEPRSNFIKDRSVNTYSLRGENYHTAEIASLNEQVLMWLDQLGFFHETAKELQSFEITLQNPYKNPNTPGKDSFLTFVITTTQKPSNGFVVVQKGYQYKPIKGKRFDHLKEKNLFVFYTEEQFFVVKPGCLSADLYILVLKSLIGVHRDPILRKEKRRYVCSN